MNQGRNGSRFNELMNYGNNSESFLKTGPPMFVFNSALETLQILQTH